MTEQFPDGHMVLRLGDTSGDYYKWKAAVWAVRELPEYKMRKLWKLNFSIKDIEQDKHWAVFPPDGKARKRKVLGRSEETARGRKVSHKKKLWLYARACRDVAEGLLAFHALDSAMRTGTIAERDHFANVMKENAHKKPKEG